MCGGYVSPRVVGGSKPSDILESFTLDKNRNKVIVFMMMMIVTMIMSTMFLIRERGENKVKTMSCGDGVVRRSLLGH